MKKFLTIEDLYNYYSSMTENAQFDSKDANGEIVVQMAATTTFDEDDEKPSDLMPVILKACHTGLNDNGFVIAGEVMEKALPTFLNKPILGFIHEVDGVPQFHRHDHHTDDDGNMVYDEYPVGSIPESANPHLEHDDESDKDYVVVHGLLYENYSKAAEILMREKTCAVSVELGINKLDYDANTKRLEIQDFVFHGVTILGVNEDGNMVEPGMAGSNITLADFSAESNSYFDDTDKAVINEPVTGEPIAKPIEPVEPDTKITEEGGRTEMSYEELRAVIEKLINTDEDFHNCVAATYDGYFIYHDWNADIFYKQSYENADGIIALTGESVEVFTEWLTADERAKLDEIRADYPVIKDELDKYKAEPEKQEILDKYAEVLSDNAEFASLNKRENHFNMSIDELNKAIDTIVLDTAKNQMFEKKHENKPVSCKHLEKTPHKQSRYGNLFSR